MVVHRGRVHVQGSIWQVQDTPGGDNMGWGDVAGIQWTEARGLLKTLQHWTETEPAPRAKSELRMWTAVKGLKASG